MVAYSRHCTLKNQEAETLVGRANKMLKAVRASITSGIISFISSRPKVVPLQSQVVLYGILLLEDGFALLQEDGSEIIL
jgi:hypothetical protein